jgi:diguanylate cyclase
VTTTVEGPDLLGGGGIDDADPVARRHHAWLAFLPEGNHLSPWVWERRHAAIVRIALVQSVFAFLFGLYRGLPPLHAAGESSVIVLCGLWAWRSRGSRAVRSGLATVALVTTSAVLVHTSGGVTEWHFHFFVMVGLITLYQDWAPFIVAIVYVVLHHGVLGSFDPEGVYGTPEAIRAPWQWALLHAAFVLAAAAVHVVAWKLNEDQGRTDPLTGLSNRLGFTDLVDEAIRRTGSVAVLYVDLDGFKAVNDGLGHDAGDDVLRQVSARMRDATRSSDRVARLGGDEFAALLPGVDADGARRIADRILLALGDPLFVHAHHREAHVGGSVGIALSEPGVDGTELVRRADIAMYSAKSAGGGRLALFTDGLEALRRERAALAEDLHHAIERDQLRLVYQPTVDLSTGRVRGVEALLRWDHPERGEVQPSQFIPIAEETGTIVALGAWVIERGVAQLATWRDEAIDISLAVNVSARQLEEPGFVDDLLAVLDAHDVPAYRLVVELTESVLVRDLDDLAARLDLLRMRGVRVAIDDFGTGYSSMSYLRRLPVDIVKIDRSFVRGVATGATESALVRSIVELAETLNIGVVAEGVEEDDQATVLRSLRCQTGQGFFWSRPVAPGAIAGLVQAADDAAVTRTG